MMIGRHRLKAALPVCGLTVIVALSLLLDLRFGAPGVALVTLIASGGTTQAQFHFTRARLGIRMFDWRILLPVGVSPMIAGGTHACIARDQRPGSSRVVGAALKALALRGAIAAKWLLTAGEIGALLPLPRRLNGVGKR